MYSIAGLSQRNRRDEVPLMLGALIFVAGFACGYAIRAYVSYRRRNRYRSIYLR
jgi:hypothetical protein